MTQANRNGDSNAICETDRRDDAADKQAKRPYAQPVLVCHGDVRDVTLGLSGGIGESGMTATKKA